MKAFEVASTKSWKLHPRNLRFYFYGSFRSFHGISAAFATAPTDVFVLYTTVPSVELTAFSTTWLTHTVYEKGSFTVQWLVVAFHSVRVRVGVW